MLLGNNSIQVGVVIEFSFAWTARKTAEIELDILSLLPRNLLAFQELVALEKVQGNANTPTCAFLSPFYFLRKRSWVTI